MRKSVLLTGLLMLAASSLFSQQYEIPKPTGPYQIGTRYMYWVDESRPDVHTSDPNDYRSISIQAFYPAEPNVGEQPKTYGSRAALEYCVNLGYWKPEIMDDVGLKPSNSYLNAEIAEEEDSYPVVFYSASGVLDANVLLAEELASHGYVVVCLGHPHWCEYYFDSEGEVFFRDKEEDVYNKKMWEELNSPLVLQTKEQLTRAETLEDKLALQEKLNESAPVVNDDVKLWVEDISFVINELEEMNRSKEIFQGRLDLRRIGVMGYSKGGAAAGQACLSEKRCKAGVNLDGFMYGDVAKKQLTTPFMVMESIEPWCEDCLPINDLLFHTSKSSIYMLQVEGSSHGNFTDTSALQEYLTDQFKSVLGSIDGKRFSEIQNTYVLQFFNKYLRALPAPLLDGPSEEYPEVRFKSRDASKVTSKS